MTGFTISCVHGVPLVDGAGLRVWARASERGSEKVIDYCELFSIWRP